MIVKNLLNMKFAWKWLICSWLHWRRHCYPEVNKSHPKIRIIRLFKRYWHCDKCHPCGEVFDQLLAEIRSSNGR